MDKKTYLERLATALHENCQEKQSQDILADYSDFFDSGIAEGKSEEALCKEFGPPEQAVRELRITTEPVRDTPIYIRAMCITLSILTTIAFLIYAYDSLRYGDNLSFLVVLIYPLALQGIISLRLSTKTPVKEGFHWVPRVQIALILPIVVSLGNCIGFALYLDRYVTRTVDYSSPYMVFMTQSGWFVILISVLIPIISGVFFLLYTIHGHPNARRLLFVDSAILTLIIDLFCGTAAINNHHNGKMVIVYSLLNAILPNLVAAILFLLLQKSSTYRKKDVWVNQINSLNTVCIGAGILMTAVFFGIAIFYCLPNGYQNFWPALLFPLAIQGIVAFRLSSGIPVKQSLRWVPRVQVILGALIALSLGITIYFTFLVEKMKINEPYVLSLMYFVPWAIRISILLLITSGVLFILYTVNGHTKARWFLFADSTLLVVFFNFMYGLSNISTPYYGINVVGCSFFFAILPNLAATVLFLAQQKLHDYQRRSAWTVK